MRVHDVPGGDLSVFIEFPDGSESPFFRTGSRPDGRDSRLAQQFAIATVFGHNNLTEFEAIEWREQGTPRTNRPLGVKLVVRERPQVAMRLPLLLPNGRDYMAEGLLATFGHTIYGGEGEDPREPWAEFVITDPGTLAEAFGSLDMSGRRPNDSGTYVVINPGAGGSLMASIAPTVNGRVVTFTRCREITLNLNPDADGRPGRIRDAWVRKVAWVEGDAR